ncbi:MAG: hypothetical protein L0Y77_07080, partial [Chlorobi bacterium]|nr:hypothetical protein [Chlorobiota bacterium]
LVKYWNSDKHDVMKSLKRILLLAMVGLVILLLFVILFEKLIIKTLVGEQEVASLLLYMIVVAQFFLQLALITQKPLELGSKTISMLFILFICIVIHLLITTNFIQSHGLFSVAGSLMVISILYNLLCFIYTRKTI